MFLWWSNSVHSKVGPYRGDVGNMARHTMNICLTEKDAYNK